MDVHVYGKSRDTEGVCQDTVRRLLPDSRKGQKLFQSRGDVAPVSIQDHPGSGLDLPCFHSVESRRPDQSFDICYPCLDDLKRSAVFRKES